MICAPACRIRQEGPARGDIQEGPGAHQGTDPSQWCPDVDAALSGGPFASKNLLIFKQQDMSP